MPPSPSVLSSLYPGIWTLSVTMVVGFRLSVVGKSKQAYGFYQHRFYQHPTTCNRKLATHSSRRRGAQFLERAVESPHRVVVFVLDRVIQAIQPGMHLRGAVLIKFSVVFERHHDRLRSHRHLFGR